MLDAIRMNRTDALVRIIAPIVTTEEDAERRRSSRSRRPYARFLAHSSKLTRRRRPSVIQHTRFRSMTTTVCVTTSFDAAVRDAHRG